MHANIVLLQDMFGHVSSEPRQRGRYYLFYTYDSISGGAVLAALVAGDAAVEFEAKPEAVAVGEVMALLRGIFGPQGVVVPEPLQVRCAGGGAALQAYSFATCRQCTPQVWLYMWYVCGVYVVFVSLKAWQCLSRCRRTVHVVVLRDIVHA